MHRHVDADFVLPAHRFGGLVFQEAFIGGLVDLAFLEAGAGVAHLGGLREASRWWWWAAAAASAAPAAARCARRTAARAAPSRRHRRPAAPSPPDRGCAARWRANPARGHCPGNSRCRARHWRPWPERATSSSFCTANASQPFSSASSLVFGRPGRPAHAAASSSAPPSTRRRAASAPRSISAFGIGRAPFSRCCGHRPRPATARGPAAARLHTASSCSGARTRSTCTPATGKPPAGRDCRPPRRNRWRA